MNYIHHEYDAGPDEVIEVALNRKANVHLLDEENYRKYDRGEKFTYAQGGWAVVSPVHLHPLYQGHWHVVVDLGGYPGRLQVSVEKKAQERAVENKTEEQQVG